MLTAGISLVSTSYANCCTVKAANRRHQRHQQDTGLPTARLSRSLCVYRWPVAARGNRSPPKFCEWRLSGTADRQQPTHCGPLARLYLSLWFEPRSEPIRSYAGHRFLGDQASSRILIGAALPLAVCVGPLGAARPGLWQPCPIIHTECICGRQTARLTAAQARRTWPLGGNSREVIHKFGPSAPAFRRSSAQPPVGHIVCV